MDAHTLNAWTRFALQKGGIGTCTALIDNPATDQEDLMFMTGEKIIVLRRLDDDETGGGKRRSAAAAASTSDADAWFLGYCEGVVGRFKGGHVQFHGKLKKPVLMRRSGTSSVRESTIRPMSKSEAVNMHASQVPPGMPFAAIFSDGEEEGSSSAYAKQRSAVDAVAEATATLNGVGLTNGRHPNNLSTSPAKGNFQQANGIHRHPGTLGITTPPLSDETHRRTGSLSNDDAESDVSESVLPWARRSTESSAEFGAPSAQHSEPAAAMGSMWGKAGLKAVSHLNTSNLPPSPISSNESPIHGKLENGASHYAPIERTRVPGHVGKSPSASSSRSTTDSEEDASFNRRRDYTFSIYDVYNRDSVAFPNFSMDQAMAAAQGINPRGSPRHSPAVSGVSRSDLRPPQSGVGIAPGSSGLRLDTSEASRANLSAEDQPITPKDPRRPSDPGPSVAATTSAGLAMRAASRRPSAAPDPRGNGATTLLPSQPLPQQTSNAPGPAGQTDPQFSQPPQQAQPPTQQQQQQQQLPPQTARPSPGDSFLPSSPERQPGFGFDPRRRPSAPASTMPQPSFANRPDQPSSPMFSSFRTLQPAGRDSPASSASFVPGQPIGTRPSQDTLSVMTDIHPRVSSEGSRSNGSVSPGFPPHRSSSDRTSERERGSWQLKKNPSNPLPGGGQGRPSNLTLTPNPISRTPSPSPLGTSPGAYSAPGGMGSPSMAPSTPTSARFRNISPVPSPGPGAMPNGGPLLDPNGMPIRFDSLGFVAGSGPDFLPPRESSEVQESWHKILSENDLAAARKSRKVKKMVRDGIPASLRGRVWLFLANSSFRRRPGLFEMLCKQAQAPKGRKGKEDAYAAIEKDVSRSFPDHRLFIGENSTGKADLEAILKAYVQFNPYVGYTQGMGLIAGIFMLQMPPEDAFWMLCALLREPHMEGYFTNNLKQLHVDGVVFNRLLEHMDPPLHARLVEIGLDASHFAPGWFLPLFVRILPWQTLLRVWDVFFWEGPVWVLRVGLALVRILRDTLMDTRKVPGHGEALQILLHPPQQLLTPDNVLSCALSAKLKDGEVRKLSRNASKLVRQDISQQNRGRSMERGQDGSRPSSAPARPRA